MRKKGLLLVAFALILCVGCQKTDDKKKEKESVEITKDRQDDGYSPILTETEIDEDKEYPYEIKVNKAQNCITVYGADDTGKYIIPVRAMICSTGGEETPDGTFQLGETSRWQMEDSGEFCQYATRIVDDVVFCSAPYYSQNNEDLNVEQFNKMGQDVSGSSIQLEVADAKWIAKNCPAGTKVEIYEDKEEGPLGKPQARILEDDVKKDPTDTGKDSKKSRNYVPVEFDGIEDKVIGVSQGCDLLAGISAQDSDKQDLTARIQVFGDVDVTTPGIYQVVYMCQNEDMESRLVKCNIQVTEEVTQADEATGEVVQPVTTTTPNSQVEQNVIGESSESSSDAEEDTVVFVDPNLIPDSTPTPQPTPTPRPTQVPQPTQAPAVTQNTQSTTTAETYYNDIQSPRVQIVANTRYVADIEEATLTKRIRVTDDSGELAGIYITVQPLKQKSYYVIIYEAEDGAGNKTCISETVQIPEPTVFP